MIGHEHFWHQFTTIYNTVKLALDGHSVLQWKMAINLEWLLKARLTLAKVKASIDCVLFIGVT